MPFFFVLAAPLVLVGVVALALGRGRTGRAAAERPSIEAAHRIARRLSGALEDGRVLRVACHVEGTRVVCSISRGSPLVSIEVASSASLPTFHVSRHAIGGRELADFPGSDVFLATDEAAELLAGTRSPACLPDGMRAAMERIDTSWISVRPRSITFVGVGGPTTDEQWPLFRERLDHALALAATIASRAAE